MNRIILFVFFAGMLISCGGKKTPPTSTVQKLPYLGEPMITSHEENGKLVPDTMYPTIPPFSFTNQDGETVTEKTFDGIYVADFFFTTCPTICPKMKAELLRVYNAFKNEPRVKILSHSIDPEYDTVEVLHEYASRLQVTSDKWDFVTGNKDSIYNMAEYYLSSAEEAPNEPGGFIHSGALILVDKQKHIRGMYDGTKPEEVDNLIKDIPILLNEPEQKR
jgi:protein SCO1/2